MSMYVVLYVRTWRNSHGVLCEETKEIGRGWDPRDGSAGADCEITEMPPPETQVVEADGSVVALTPKWRFQVRERRTKTPEVYVKR